VPDDTAADALDFPMRFPVKAMGRSDEAFVELVVSLVRPFVGPLEDVDVESRDSRGGRYRSVTVTFTAHSREQLDDVYRALTGHAEILYVL